MGQTNSVTPGPTVRIIRHPAQRTWTPGAAGAAAGPGGCCWVRGGGGIEGWAMMCVEKS